MDIYEDLFNILDNTYCINLPKDKNPTNVQLINIYLRLLNVYNLEATETPLLPIDTSVIDPKVINPKRKHILSSLRILGLEYLASKPSNLYDKKKTYRVIYALHDKIHTQYGKTLAQRVRTIIKREERQIRKSLQTVKDSVQTENVASEERNRLESSTLSSSPEVVIPLGRQIPRTPFKVEPVKSEEIVSLSPIPSKFGLISPPVDFKDSFRTLKRDAVAHFTTKYEGDIVVSSTMDNGTIISPVSDVLSPMLSNCCLLTPPHFFRDMSSVQKINSAVDPGNSEEKTSVLRGGMVDDVVPLMFADKHCISKFTCNETFVVNKPKETTRETFLVSKSKETTRETFFVSKPKETIRQTELTVLEPNVLEVSQGNCAIPAKPQYSGRETFVVNNNPSPNSTSSLVFENSISLFPIRADNPYNGEQSCINSSTEDSEEPHIRNESINSAVKNSTYALTEVTNVKDVRIAPTKTAKLLKPRKEDNKITSPDVKEQTDRHKNKNRKCNVQSTRRKKVDNVIASENATENHSPSLVKLTHKTVIPTSGGTDKKCTSDPIPEKKGKTRSGGKKDETAVADEMLSMAPSEHNENSTDIDKGKRRTNRKKNSTNIATKAMLDTSLVNTQKESLPVKRRKGTQLKKNKSTATPHETEEKAANKITKKKGHEKSKQMVAAVGNSSKGALKGTKKETNADDGGASEAVVQASNRRPGRSCKTKAAESILKIFEEF